MKDIKRNTEDFVASARAIITMKSETVRKIMDNHNQELKEVRYFAEDAGYKAAVKTQRSIPMCLPLPVGSLYFEFLEYAKNKIEIKCSIRTKSERTSAGMEALSAASMAAFVLKERCDLFDDEMNVSDLEILEMAS